MVEHQVNLIGDNTNVAPNTETALSVRGLTTIFGRPPEAIAAVRDVSIDLPRGKRLGLVGESGSGKSAFAMSVLGLIGPPGQVVAGDVWLSGTHVPELTDSAMRRFRGKSISLVYQDPMAALDPVMTIGQQIMEAIRIHTPRIDRRELRERTLSLLEDVEIPGAERIIQSYPHELSGGMRQRVVIAMALANAPGVVIADEPTTALDVTTQAQILRLFDKIVAEHGTSVLLITHNLGVVAEFCDLVIVMYGGRIVESGTVGDVFDSPVHPYTDALLRAQPTRGLRRGARLETIPGMPRRVNSEMVGCSFADRCARPRSEELCRTVDPRSAMTPALLASRPVECHFPVDHILAQSEARET